MCVTLSTLCPTFCVNLWFKSEGNTRISPRHKGSEAQNCHRLIDSAVLDSLGSFVVRLVRWGGPLLCISLTPGLASCLALGSGPCFRCRHLWSLLYYDLWSCMPHPLFCGGLLLYDTPFDVFLGGFWGKKPAIDGWWTKKNTDYTQRRSKRETKNGKDDLSSQSVSSFSYKRFCRSSHANNKIFSSLLNPFDYFHR